jgi:S1-C subfamily serine protease
MRRAFWVASLLIIGGCNSAPQSPRDTANVNAANEPNIVAHQGARLGARFVPVASGSGAALKLNSDRGLIVAVVLSGGLAAKTGIAKGDILLTVDGSAVNSGADLTAALNAAASHHSAIFELSRDGVKRSVTIPL